MPDQASLTGPAGIICHVWRRPPVYGDTCSAWPQLETSPGTWIARPLTSVSAKMKKSPMLFAADAVLAVTAPGPDPIPAQPGSAASAVAPETVAAQATATAPAAISS